MPFGAIWCRCAALTVILAVAHDVFLSESRLLEFGCHGFWNPRCAPEREKRGALVTAEVDFDIEFLGEDKVFRDRYIISETGRDDMDSFVFQSRLDVEDRIADKADARLQRLRKVMFEMDKKARAHFLFAYSTSCFFVFFVDGYKHVTK